MLTGGRNQQTSGMRAGRITTGAKRMARGAVWPRRKMELEMPSSARGPTRDGFPWKSRGRGTKRWDGTDGTDATICTKGSVERTKGIATPAI